VLRAGLFNEPTAPGKPQAIAHLDYFRSPKCCRLVGLYFGLAALRAHVEVAKDPSISARPLVIPGASLEA